MSRAFLATILLAGCSFTPGVSHEGARSDASGPHGDDASPISDDGNTVAAACHTQIPGVRVCLDFDSQHLSDDSSGLANSVQIQSVNTMPRAAQRAALLDSSSSISIADSPNLDLGGPLSLEMWVFPSVNTTAPDRYLVSSYNQYGLAISNGHLWCSIKAAGSFAAATVQANATIPTSQWTHVACVFDGRRLAIYVNGAGSGCTNQMMTIETGVHQGIDLGIGYQGGLDDVHVYGTALTDTDVCTLATGGTSCKPMPICYSGN
jgi:hypothetical protein